MTMKQPKSKKRNPTPAQIRARKKFAAMVRAKAKTKKRNGAACAANRKRNHTVIKAKRVKIAVTNPRARNKATRLSEADLSKLSPAAQKSIRAQIGKIEKEESKATTPAQIKQVERKRRSFLSRLGTRLRVAGQTRKYKVSARSLDRCPRKVVKVRARHETDALSKAQSKMRGPYDQFKVQNGRKRNAPSKARAIREKFTGMKSTKTATMNAPKGTPASLAKLGKLISIKTAKGVIKPGNKNPGGVVWLCTDAKGKLHLCTSAPQLIDGPARDFGEVREVEYEAIKPHLGYKRPTIFFHKMGEESGKRPALIADGEGGLKFRGGNYRIASEGIVD